MQNIIDGQLFKKMIINASNNLENNKTMVDDLNVFPVPDGDTGTNMSMTISAAARELLAKEETSISEISNFVASASLRGARGNSGVILSQLFRGFSRALKDIESIDTIKLAEALKAGNDTAYKAVMKPTEGTILTVARETAVFAVEIAPQTPDILEFAERILEKAKETLSKTPDMLPVLKQAGVVDAGGMGLIIILEGALKALKGEEIFANLPVDVKLSSTFTNQIDTENIKFTYCTEFIINKKSLNYSIARFRSAIEPKGDSLLAIEDEEIVKVHIHTNNPGFVLEQAIKIGDISNIKIDNMKLQHEEISSQPAKQFGIVAVASGDGLEQLLKEIGVDIIVKGGQSMNPSTEDILEAVKKVNAENIFVLPNNKNIILAAQQVNELTDKNVIVIPTKSIPQGISAVLAFDANFNASDNIQNMTDAISYVKTGQVTFAARDSEFEGKSIKKDDIMGIEEGKISIIGTNPNEIALQVVESLADDDSAVISIFFGSDISEAQSEELCAVIKEKYPKLDVLMHFGGQPLYYYIISVE